MVVNLIQNLAKIGYRASTLGLEKGPHITRYYMYNHISKYCESRPCEHRVLSISESGYLANLLGYDDNQITDLTYPDVNVLDLPLQDEQFDAVVSDQVLEHIEGNPYTAFGETFRILKPGGIAVHTTCFINPIHATPNDFWRFTPDALKLLACEHGEVIDVGGWGNPFIWVYNALGLRFELIPHANWHPGHWVATKNVERWPMVTWVLARKSYG
jgi:SAM-dependent methyltransferase